MTIIRFTTIPESFSIEIWKEDELYTKTILAALTKISPEKLPVRLMQNELQLFHQLLENDLRKRLQLYEPARGSEWPEIIFGKEYLLTKLSKQHESIHSLNYLYEAVGEFIKNN